MSHFTVMIIGNDPEKQLAPYDENIQTTPRDMGAVSEEEKQRMIDYYKDPENGGIVDLSFDELYTLKGDAWDGNSLVRHEDGTWHEYTTYNPDSKWDWYELGGRWADYLKLKSGADGIKGEPSLLMKDFESKEDRADAAQKKDIDFEGMRDEAGKLAGETYDKAIAIIGDLPVNESWETIRRRHTKDDTDYTNIDAARIEYGAQPRVQAFNKGHEFGFRLSPEDFNISREQYVQNARDGAVSTFAILKDGVWYEKGNMGWWACVSDEKEQKSWNKQVSDMLDELPEDTLISIFDCHI